MSGPAPAPRPAFLLYQGDCRQMPELADGTVNLVVTSPPYWQIKDYGCEGQVGAGESLHGYLRSLAMVWEECLRVLAPGGRL
jgi:modification methylase